MNEAGRAAAPAAGLSRGASPWDHGYLLALTLTLCLLTLPLWPMPLAGDGPAPWNGGLLPTAAAAPVDSPPGAGVIDRAAAAQAPALAPTVTRSLSRPGSPAAAAVGPPPGPAVPAPSSFLRVRGTRFYDGCRPFYFAGANVWALTDLATGEYFPHRSDGSRKDGRVVVSDLMAAASAAGLNSLRFFLPTVTDRRYALLTEPRGDLSEAVLSVADWVLAEAGRHGLRLIVVLLDFWQAQGGVQDLLRFCAPGGVRTDTVNLDPLTGHFFRDPACRAAYKSLMAQVLLRNSTVTGRPWRDEPTIAAWELINEPRMKASWAPAGAAPTLPAWVDEMARYAKALDPNHLVSVGEEGFYSDDSGREPYNPNSPYFGRWARLSGQDFVADHASAAVDFASMHVWMDNWGLTADGSAGGKLPGGPAANGYPLPEDGVVAQRRYIRARAADAQRTLRKPLLLEEFGKEVTAEQHAAREFAERDRYTAAAYADVEEAVAEGSMAGSLVWHLVDEPSDYSAPYYGIYPSHTTWGLVQGHAQRLAARAASQASDECGPDRR